MSSVNVNAREVAAKIVFYGPGLSGKTTTLRRIHESLKPEQRGDMMSLATEGDRTLFFDFLPVRIERVQEYAVRLALYTVPGQVFYNATRKLVLQGADGVVFVADSQPEALDSNRESFQSLEENLLEQGIRLEQFPLVIQYNKRDIPGALPVDLLRHTLNGRGVPDFETCATNGRGVLDALKLITRLVMRSLKAKRVVVPARAAPTHSSSLSHRSDPMQEQVQEQLQTLPSEYAQPGGGAELLGVLGTLSPPEFVEMASAAESAYAAGDFASCVQVCQQAVQYVLLQSGEASLPAQAYFFRIDGTDLARLGSLGQQTAPDARDAAFALYVALQAMVRLAQSRYH